VVGELANKMLGFNLTTKQTPKDGVKVKMVSRKKKEIYFPLSSCFDGALFLLFLTSFRGTASPAMLFCKMNVCDGSLAYGFLFFCCIRIVAVRCC